jgi:hypothetical protein
MSFPTGRDHHGMQYDSRGNYRHLMLVQVRMQGDAAKPLEKRLNYRHCFDALFRVCGIRIRVLRHC